MTLEDIASFKASFLASVKRALIAGFDVRVFLSPHHPSRPRKINLTDLAARPSKSTPPTATSYTPPSQQQPTPCPHPTPAPSKTACVSSSNSQPQHAPSFPQPCPSSSASPAQTGCRPSPTAGRSTKPSHSPSLCPALVWISSTFLRRL